MSSLDGKVAAITGAVEPCETKFDFTMSVARVHEDPRVTKPYSDEQWERIKVVGGDVDNCRRAMPGEGAHIDVRHDAW